MNKLNRLMLALTAGVISVPALAADHVKLDPVVAATHASLALAPTSRVRAQQPATVKNGNAEAPKVMGTQTQPGSLFANPFRAYPPSCAADPLPDRASGTTYSSNATLFARDAQGAAYLENVTITIWRIACSSSGDPVPYNLNGYPNAMTLMRIDRAANYEGDRDIFPTFPLIEASQNGSAFGTPASFVRLAVEPNTVISEVPFDSPIYDSTTYVLENYPYAGSGYFTYSDAFTLRIDPGTSSVAPTDIAVAAYVPGSIDPPQPALRPFDGYVAAQWVNRTTGEGMLVQVSEQPQADGSTVRQFIFDLLTKDLNGNPIWLVGNAAFPVGQTSPLTVQTIYLGNALAHEPWGTTTFQIEDCNHLNVTFDANAQLPSPVPAFNETRVYDRLFAPNGLVCE